MNQSLKNILDSLLIPPSLSYELSGSDDQEFLRRTKWLADVPDALHALRGVLKSEPEVDLEIETYARVVTIVVRFRGEGPWSNASNLELANDVLALLPTPPTDLARFILSKAIKPAFSTTIPHPQINLETGRKLARPAGGKEAAQDFYDDQKWKEPGISEVLHWCVSLINKGEWENLWPLVIPPVMTLLDDYQPKYKLQGVKVVQAMFPTVSPILLARTGIKDLLFKSLNSALTYLNDPCSPALIRETVPATISLISLSCPTESSERFERLFHLLGEGIIGGVWAYSSRDVGSIQASMDVLPEILDALGIASVRFLKALVPQLVHPLKPQPFRPPNLPLQLSSLKALVATIKVCEVRIHAWTADIVDGLARCWVDLLDNPQRENEQLRESILSVTKLLLKTCPSVADVEFQRLLALDKAMFKEFTWQ